MVRTIIVAAGLTALAALAGCASSQTSATTAATPSQVSTAPPAPSATPSRANQPPAFTHPQTDPSTGEPVCYYTLSQGGGIEVVMQVQAVSATRCYLSAFDEVDALDPGGVYLTGAWKYVTSLPANPGFEIGGCSGDVEAANTNNDDGDTVGINLIGPNQGATNNTPPVENATSAMDNACNQVGLEGAS